MATTAPDIDARDHAAALLRMALPLMSRHGVPVTPNNYAVWYRYASGTDSELRQAIDAHIESGKEFTQHFNDMLYQYYVLESNEQMMEKVRQSLRALLTAIGQTFDKTDQGLGQFVDRLGEHCQRLQGEVSADELDALAAALLADTTAARGSGQELRRALVDGKRETEELRVELQRALTDASTDPLTGLGNRRALYRAARELTDMDGESSRCSLVFADIDHFKSINDRCGHLVGDKVLGYVATVLHSSVKGRDTVTRYGGEEFVVLLPDTPYEGAMHVAESLRANIESGRLVRSGTRERIGTVTASFGVAEWRPGDSLEDLIARADAALFAAKRGGRNRVVGERELDPAALEPGD